MKNFNNKQKLQLNTHIQNILYLFLICNYILVLLLIILVYIYDLSTVRFFFIEISRTGFCGVLSELLVVFLLLLTLLYNKKGIITGTCLFLIYLVNCIMALFRFNSNNNALTGITMLSIGYFTCILLYHNSRKINKNYLLLQEQRNMLNKMAYYDSLTKLPNHNRIKSEIDSLLANTNPDTDSFAIIRIDVDNYRLLRDYLGHSKAEEELALFASHLMKSIHPLDMPGRIESDEFIILVERSLTKKELQEYVLHLQQSLTHRISCNQNSIYLNTSYGICMFPEHGTRTETLLQYADTACYEAKKDTDHHICFFNQTLYQHLAYRTQIDNALKESIANNELYLVYQPQYSSRNKKLRGFEALLRWKSPSLGAISPATFIPVAEENGCIIPIGAWVLEQACTTFKRIMDWYETYPIISINISVVQLLDSSFLDTVSDILNRTSFPPELLEFEITESVLISSKERVIRVLNEFKKMGIHIALDDFGTEYASLSYLQQLPLDILKIDKSFVSHIGKEEKVDMVEAILTIAKQQSLITVAEGIETETQLSYLQKRGCQYIQGFLWGRPIDEENLLNLLAELKSQHSLPLKGTHRHQ